MNCSLVVVVVVVGGGGGWLVVVAIGSVTYGYNRSIGYDCFDVALQIDLLVSVLNSNSSRSLPWC